MSRFIAFPKPLSTSRQQTPAAVAYDDVRRRAFARLGERIDFAKSRHKPASLVRQEAIRVLEQFLELEAPHWPRPEIDRLIDDVLGEALGSGPLEQLFRDPAVNEFMVMAHNVIIYRKGDVWLPTSTAFRDADQYRAALAKFAELGEHLVPGVRPAGAIDVKLSNGFRLIAVLPPEVLEQPAPAVFVRGVPAVATTPAPAPPRPAAAAAIPIPPRATGPARTGSDVVSFDGGLPPAAGGSMGGGSPGSASGPMSGRYVDPIARLKQRVTERLVRKLAAAGVYDLSQVPMAEFERVISANVADLSAAEKLGLDDDTQARLTLEILAGMPR